MTADPKPKTDGQLLDDYLRTGDEEPFREIVVRHSPMLRLAAERMMAGDRSAADDIVQSVFILLIEKARTLRTAADIGGWLYRSLYFIGKAYRRLEARRSVVTRKLAESRDGMERTEPADPVVRQEAIRQLDEAMTVLDPASVQAVVLQDRKSVV